MNRCAWLLPILLFPFAVAVFDADAKPGKKPAKSITWKKIVLDKEFRSEGVGVADVNKDGKLDVIVGDCWYEAPKVEGGEWKRHILRADRKWDLGKYTESFCCFTGDFNGDGWPDVIVIPFPGKPCYWYENPGEKGGMWKEHLLTTSACNETPIYVDLFKTGKKLLVMGWNPPNENKMGEMCYFVPGKDPTKPWDRISISGPSTKEKQIPGTEMFSHGLGHGDVNGDGRIDIIVPQGWWEQPEKADGTPWKFHAVKVIDAKGKDGASPACADMYTYDLDGDGKAGIISTSAHGYGFWAYQQKDANTFVQRVLFPNPFEVATMPQGLKLSAAEKDLLDAVNLSRRDQFTAPLAIDPKLCDLARRYAQVVALGLKVDFGENDIRKAYSGKLVDFRRGYFETAELNKLIAVLKENFEKEGQFVHPWFQIGVGAQKGKNGKVLYVLLVGDRGKFSLPSQTHALQMVDIDGDGLPDLVTGRRWWAHGPRGDAGPNDPAYLYWFQAKRSKDGMVSFTPHLIDDDSGVGTSFAIADMNGDGLPDVIVANKKGVYVFLQQR